jgi:hypothetical protein
MNADDTIADPASMRDTSPGHCARCAHWADDRALLEACIAGLASFGSAYGASVGASRLCLRHDRLTMPADRCAAFVEAVEAICSRTR